MGHDQFERSNYDGAPIDLYEFSLGTTVWRYASGQNDLQLNGETYSAVAIKRDGFTLSGDPQTDDLKINITRRAPVTDLFVGTPPSEPLTLRIRTLHRGDEEAPVVWAGSVKSSRQTSAIEVEFNCNSLLASLNRNGLRLSWGRGCPHALYDRNCGVNMASHGVSVQILTLSGDAITAAVSTLGNDYLSGGLLSFVGDHGALEMRAIEGHYQGRIRLLGTTDGLSVGDWVKVYPGCARTTEVCETKFNNLGNYGGFPHLPTKSPFDGDPVF